MPKIIRAGFYAIFILIVLSSVLVTGCPAPQDDGPEQPANDVIENEDPSDDEPSSDESAANGGDEGTVAEGSGRGPITVNIVESDLEELESIFGALVYPESILMDEESTVQKLAEGTEIYRIGFASTSTVGTVAAWFEERAEPGMESGELTLGLGTKVYSFDYRSIEDHLSKTITITGFPEEAHCKIGIYIFRAVELEEDPVEGSE